MLVVGCGKALLLAGVVGRCADEGQHLGAAKQAKQVVVMAQKILGEAAGRVAAVLGQALLVLTL